MSFRRPKGEAHDARAWRDFVADQRHLFDRAGLPGVSADRSSFDYFLMNGYLPMPGESETTSLVNIDKLEDDQRRAIARLAKLYIEQFGDPGCSNAIFAIP